MFLLSVRAEELVFPTQSVAYSQDKQLQHSTRLKIFLYFGRLVESELWERMNLMVSSRTLTLYRPLCPAVSSKNPAWMSTSENVYWGIGQVHVNCSKKWGFRIFEVVCYKQRGNNQEVVCYKQRGAGNNQ